MRRIVFYLLIPLAIVTLASTSLAQEGLLRDVESPLDEEFDYRVGEQLELNVRVDGLGWRWVRIDGGDPAEFEDGKDTRVEISLEADNQTNDTLALDIILLLEDASGNQLERVELKKFKVPGGRLKQDSQKVRIDGGVLAEMGKIYIFAEVS